MIEIKVSPFIKNAILCNKVEYQESVYVENYVPTSSQNINEYIMNFFLYGITNFKDQIFKNINTPYGFTPVKRMRLIHGYDDYLNES